MSGRGWHLPELPGGGQEGAAPGSGRARRSPPAREEVETRAPLESRGRFVHGLLSSADADERAVAGRCARPPPNGTAGDGRSHPRAAEPGLRNLAGLGVAQFGADKKIQPTLGIVHKLPGRFQVSDVIDGAGDVVEKRQPQGVHHPGPTTLCPKTPMAVDLTTGGRAINPPYS